MLRFLVLIAVVSLTIASLKGDEGGIAPRRSVLVLRNRQTLEGEITKVGDHYRVVVSPGSEIRVATADVERVCESLEAAYRQKSGEIGSDAPERHLDLAEWCIRQKLYDFAVREIIFVSKVDPQNQRIRLLQEKLEAAAAKPASTQNVTERSSATVAGDQLEELARELPAEAVRRFSTAVQPVLLDRCGNAKCHGAGGNTAFQLVQPSPGRLPSRRFMQRNLYSAVQAIDRESPEESKILEMARTPHGHVAKAAFEREEDRQFRILRDWVASLGPVETQPQRPAAIQVDHITRHQSQSGTTKSDEASPSVNTSSERDPFDPEVFNRRYAQESGDDLKTR